MRFFIFFFLSFTIHAQDITFMSSGKQVKALSLVELKKEFRFKTLTLFDPFQSSKIPFQVFKAKDVLHKIYGRNWKTFHRIQFTCQDGFKPEVPIELLIKHDSFFAFSYKDEKKPFRMFNRSENLKANLGPLYLMWDVSKEKVRKEVTSNYWPYQIVSLNLVNKNDPFDKFKPSGELKPELKGFTSYKKHCISCHKIDGIGGDKAMDLSKSNKLTKSFDKKWLKSYILNPRKTNKESTMPMMPLHLKSRNDEAQYISDFLEYSIVKSKLSK